MISRLESAPTIKTMQNLSSAETYHEGNTPLSGRFPLCPRGPDGLQSISGQSFCQARTERGIQQAPGQRPTVTEDNSAKEDEERKAGQRRPGWLACKVHGRPLQLAQPLLSFRQIQVLLPVGRHLMTLGERRCVSLLREAPQTGQEKDGWLGFPAAYSNTSSERRRQPAVPSSADEMSFG